MKYTISRKLPIIFTNIVSNYAFCPKYHRLVIFIASILLVIKTVSGQSNNFLLEGTVKNENEVPLQYANVFIEGTLIGGTTDDNGRFYFNVHNPGKYTIIATYVGYEEFKKDIEINPQESFQINIILRAKINELEPIIITASNYTSGDEKGMTLSALDVIKTPGAAADVMMAIQTYPGVQQVDEGAGLFVRGGDVSETVVIIDGAYLLQPYRFESPNGGFFGQMTPFLLKSTYFSSGGFGADYGNSLSGALVMESHDLPQSRQFDFGIGLAAFSSRIRTPLVENKLGISFSTNLTNTDIMFKLNNHKQNKKFSNHPNARDINFSIFYKYSQNGSLKLFLFDERDEVGVEVEQPGQQGRFFGGNSKSRLSNLSWKHFTNSRLLFTGNIGISTYDNASKLVSLDLDTEQLLYQGKLSGFYGITHRLQWNIGLEYFRNEDKIHGIVPIVDEDLDVNAETFEFNVDYKSYRFAVFNKWSYNFADKIKSTIGLRYEQESISNQKFVDFRSSLNWLFYSKWNFIYSTGRYHQFPTTNFSDPFVGNPNLKAMSAWHHIFGVDFQTSQEMFRLEFYFKDYNNLILNDDEINYTNEGHGFAKGVDLFLKKTWGKLDNQISASYLSAKRKSMDAPGLFPTSFDITYNLTSIFKLNFSTSWYMGVKYRYATGKPYTSAPNVYNNRRVPDYHKLDISINYNYHMFDRYFTVFYVAADNILGKQNIFDYRYSSDFTERVPITSSMLRSFYFGMNLTF